jgi:VWFA-related protein
MPKVSTGFFLFLVLSATAAHGGQRPAASPPPAFGEAVEVNVVNVEAFVTDKDGNRVQGLQKEDFAVFEDGKPVAITNFAAVEGEAAASLPAPAGALGAQDRSSTAPPIAAQAEPGVSLVVVVDNFHLRPAHRTPALEQLRKFLAEKTAPGDRVMVATYELGLHIRQPFTSDRGELEKALETVETLPTYAQQQDSDRRTALEAMYALYPQDPCGYTMVSPLEAYARAAREETYRTIGALQVLVGSLAGIPGRKALLLVSDGIAATPGEDLYQVFFEVCSGNATSGLPEVLDNSSGLSSRYPVQQSLIDAQKYSVAKQFEDLAAHANANQVTFYTLQASGLQGAAAAEADLGAQERVLQMPSVQSVYTENERASLVAMASDTGGQAILDTNNFLPRLAGMQEDFASYYSLGYTPSHSGDGLEHRIEVKVKKPGVRVRYRQSYRDKPVMERMADRTLAALFFGSEENPLDVTLTMGEQAPDAQPGLWDVPIRIKIPLFRLAFADRQGKIFQGKLRLLAVTRNGQGGLSPLRRVDVPLGIPHDQVLTALGQYYAYTLTLKLPAGRHRVALAIRDQLGASTSYLGLDVTAGPGPAAAVLRSSSRRASTDSSLTRSPRPDTL